MKYLLFLIFSIILLFSCNQEKRHVNAKKDSGIESIQVMYYPSFIGSAVFTYNVVTNKLNIQRIGLKEQYPPPPPPPEESNGSYEFYDASSILTAENKSYKVDIISSKYILDSIMNKFQQDDFQDMFMNVDDGIFNSVLIVYSDNSIKEFDMINNGTINQYKLVKNFIEIPLQQESDTTNLKYLKELIDYY